MSLGPTRHFGGQSRAANSSTRKRHSDSKSPLMWPQSSSRSLLGEEASEISPHDDTARPLTPLDLSLAPFKFGRAEHSPRSGAESPLGLVADNFVDEDSLADVEGMPSRAQWTDIVENYLESLHPTKRHKSLISREVYNMIFRTLKSPEATRLGTPQFRFWARKMFQLVEAPNDPEMHVVTNGGRPVAIKEHIYEILCMCHAECEHGGRDKTCKILREYYTWVPKELISNFVKVCPTCEPRRIVAAKTKDRKAVKEISSGGPEGSVPASSRFSVERLEDFGQHRSPLSIEACQLKLPSPVECASSVGVSQYGNVTLVSGGVNFKKSFIPRSSSLACLPSVASFPSPPWSASSSFILPPLNGTENGETEPGSYGSYGDRNVSLPPLMQYLSQSRDGTVKQPSLMDNHFDTTTSGSEVPIDPSLLAAPDMSSNSRCNCADIQCFGCAEGGNALQLRLDPSTPQDALPGTVPPSLHISFEPPEGAQEDSGPMTWHFPSAGSLYDEGDSSALLSASCMSTGLPTPSSSGHISPAGSTYVTSYHFYGPESHCIPNFGGGPYAQDQSSLKHLGAVKESKGETTLEASRASSPPLFSPLPLKVANANAMMKLEAAAAVDEVYS